MNNNFNETNPVVCKYNTIHNKTLLNKIDKGEVDIRKVMEYALDTGTLRKEEWKMMDTGDAWKWLATNKLDYKIDVNAKPKHDYFSKIKTKSLLMYKTRYAVDE